MAMIQDILAQLQNMGISADSYGGISGITPQEIQSGLSGAFGVSSSDLPSSMFTSIGSDVLKGGMAGTYSPMIEATGASLLGGLTQSMGGQEGRQAAGGFAGSGQQSRFQQQAKDVYGKGMTDVLGQSAGQRTQSLQSVMDIINKWKESALKIRGDM